MIKTFFSIYGLIKLYVVRVSVYSVISCKHKVSYLNRKVKLGIKFRCYYVESLSRFSK